MPQLARIAGYEHYIFWRCMRPEVQQADFIWRGLDGSAVLTHWLARGYANLRFPTDAEAVSDGLGRRTGNWHSLQGHLLWKGEITAWQILTLLFA